ncbi:MAG: ammonium transporter [Acidimicrobiales bacterium]
MLGSLLIANPAIAQDAYEPTIGDFLDNTFLVIAAVLVLFMQAGFALVEAGLTRAKNVANIMMKNLMDMAIAFIAFWAVGYAFAYGSDAGGFIGTDLFFLQDDSVYEGGLTLGTNFIFQVAFAGAAATIASGAMAERTKFYSYAVFSLVMTAFIYPVVVHFFWGGGIIADLTVGNAKFGDFAGSTIVHSAGGWAALMGAIFLGPRIGKYGPDGSVRPIIGHSMPLVITGCFILFIGWFGFNPGSELAADLAVPDIAVTTGLAAAAGAVGAVLTITFKSGKPDVGMAGNGLLAGLVSITAGCGTLTPLGAVITGFLGGIIVVLSVLFIDTKLKIDDPVGAVSVHGVCGVWGTLAVGLFAHHGDAFVDAAYPLADGTEYTSSGLFYGGGINQLIVQLLGVLIVAAWVLVTSGILFAAIKATMGLRVTAEEEIEGLDVLEHGAPGYGPEMSVTA